MFTSPNLPPFVGCVIRLAPSPFFDGIGLIAKYVSERDSMRRWSQECPALILQTISGQGMSGECPLVTSTLLQSNHSHNQFQMQYSFRTGVVDLFCGTDPCVYGEILSFSTLRGLCILAQLVPCITYYLEEAVLRALVGHVEDDLMRQ